MKKNRNIFFKYAIIAGISALLLIIFQFVFVLLPLYGLVGNTKIDADKELNRLSMFSDVLNVLLALSFVVVLVFIVLGLRQSKNQKDDK